MNDVIVPMQIVNNGKTPKYQTAGSCGMDCYANEEVVFEPHSYGKVSLGFKVAVPNGYVMELRGRSSLGACNVLAFNGVIDCDYRGEVSVILYNNSDATFLVKRGERVCQAVIYPCAHAVLSNAPIGETERGTGGFGSTGK